MADSTEKAHASFPEASWAYQTGGSSTGFTTLPQVRRASYHTYLSRMSSTHRHLTTFNPKTLHSRPWTSTVVVYEFPVEFSSSRVLPQPESKTCQFDPETGEYHVWRLEELHSHLVYAGVRYGARLVFCENLLPPVMEVLGSSFPVHPDAFANHIGEAWDAEDAVLDSGAFGIVAQTLNSGGYGGMMWGAAHADRPNNTDHNILFPQLFEVYHPSAFKIHSWRHECLKRATKFLQIKRLFPIFDVPDEGIVQAVGIERVTFSVSTQGDENGPWKGLIQLPMSVQQWSEGNLHVKKHQGVAMRIPNIQEGKDLSDSDPSPRTANAWLAAVDHLAASQREPMKPFHVFECLWDEALNFWSTHLAHVARAVELLSSESESDGEELRPHQQVKELIVHDTTVLSSILDTLNAAKGSNDLREATNSREWNVYHHVKGISQLHDRFSLLKIQLERYLPTLQHYIDIIIVKQQVRLAETQLEESRKAIQQADTIKRLTILAFIYIPVQTASSIFGMNVREFANVPSIYAFVISAIVLLLLTLSAAAWKHLLPSAVYVVDTTSDTFYRLVRKPLTGVGFEVPQDGWTRRRRLKPFQAVTTQYYLPLLSQTQRDPTVYQIGTPKLVTVALLHTDAKRAKAAALERICESLQGPPSDDELSRVSEIRKLSITHFKRIKKYY